MVIRKNLSKGINMVTKSMRKVEDAIDCPKINKPHLAYYRPKGKPVKYEVGYTSLSNQVIDTSKYKDVMGVAKGKNRPNC